MIDFDRIPRPIYDELVDLFGKEKAENYIEKVNYNISIINRDLLFLRLDRFFKRYKYHIIAIAVIVVITIVVSFIK